MRKHSIIKVTDAAPLKKTPGARCLTAASAAVMLFFAGCSSAPALHTVANEPASLPAHWSAPLPPDESRSTQLARWWQDQRQPELAALIEAAQRVSPNVAAARLRIAQAQAAEVQARSLLQPQVAVAVSTTTSRSPVQNPALTQVQTGLQFSWELTLATLRGADAQAARAQRDTAQLQWHDARILVAAEVAKLYQSQRNCRQQQRTVGRRRGLPLAGIRAVHPARRPQAGLSSAPPALSSAT